MAHAGENEAAENADALDDEKDKDEAGSAGGGAHDEEDVEEELDAHVGYLYRHARHAQHPMLSRQNKYIPEQNIKEKSDRQLGQMTSLFSTELERRTITRLGTNPNFGTFFLSIKAYVY